MSKTKEKVIPQCPACNEIVGEADKKCPNCGEDLEVYDEKKISEEFKTTYMTGSIIAGLGWIIMALSILSAIPVILSLSGDPELMVIVMTAAGILVALVFGLGFIAIGQLIQAQIRVAVNSTETNFWLRKIYSKMN